MNVRRSTAFVATLLACLALAAAAEAEATAYVQISGIKGSVTSKGLEGAIAAVAFEHTLVVPTDASTGMTSGKRQHKPVTITKEIDASSPLLRKALVRGESLKRVVIRFYRPNRSGVPTNYFTVQLNNVHVAGISLVMPNNSDPSTSRLPATEEISFVYQSITWTWHEGNISTNDSLK